MAGKSGRELNLKDLDVQVLFLTRKSESFNNLSETFQMEEGDVVTVFGPTTVIFDRCCDLKTVEQERVRKEKQKDAPLALLEKAPSFSLKDQDGEQRRLDDYLGKKNLVLVFYPKDKSFFCTTQLKSFNDALDSIRVFDTEVLAINNESEKSHAGFCDSSHLDFPLLSDKKRQACKAYKTLMLGGLLVDRTVYVIDKKGFIRFAQRGKPPVRDVLAILKQLQEEKVTN
jgi:peroxiredoxin Q/BCP